MVMLLSIFGGAGSAACANERIERPDSLRIERPASSTALSPSSCCGGHDKTPGAETLGVNTLGADSCCTSTETEETPGASSGEQQIESPQYFALYRLSPSEHFEQWIKMNVYPSLCATVLCQRQCALNGYESCNALGVKHSLLVDVTQAGSSCGSGGCGAAPGVAPTTNTSLDETQSKDAPQVVTTRSLVFPEPSK